MKTNGTAAVFMIGAHLEIASNGLEQLKVILVHTGYFEKLGLAGNFQSEFRMIIIVTTVRFTLYSI